MKWSRPLRRSSCRRALARPPRFASTFSMPQFAYKAMQLDGVLVEGSLDAGSRQEAMRQVEIRGLKPIRLAEAASGAAGKHPAAANGASGAADVSNSLANIKFGQPRKITARMLENFTRLLSS